MNNTGSTKDVVVIHANARTHDTIRGELIRDWGVSGTLAGSHNISMAQGQLPPGVRATPHYHPFETAILILRGKVRVFYGPDTSQFIDVHEGDFVYIPAFVVHSPHNMSVEPMDYVVARNAPEEIVMYPSNE